jgi:hypothetical protein
MANMSGWLKPLRSALDEIDRPVSFFFRDDDVGWSTPRLLALLDRFEDFGIPVDLAVIPTELTRELSDVLQERIENTPRRIGIHQHGFAHANHEVAGRKCEFGPSRSPEQQFLDVRAGQTLLKRVFGSLVCPIFTPPWNRCTTATAQVLKQLGFRTLSRDATAEKLGCHDIYELPVTTDWFRKKSGVRTPFECIGADLACTVISERPIGIMLHHEHMDEAEMKRLSELLHLLSSHERTQCTLMHEITIDSIMFPLTAEVASAR